MCEIWAFASPICFKNGNGESSNQQALPLRNYIAVLRFLMRYAVNILPFFFFTKQYSLRLFGTLLTHILGIWFWTNNVLAIPGFTDLAVEAGFGGPAGCFGKTNELSRRLKLHLEIPNCYHHHHLFRLTLVLSCAMNFKNYPHDEQLCNLKIESSKF